MDFRPLLCTELSADRQIAYFCESGLEEEIFAYLPHVPGLNPWLLRVGDEIEGRLVRRRDRAELVEVRGQRDRRAMQGDPHRA